MKPSTPRPSDQGPDPEQERAKDRSDSLIPQPSARTLAPKPAVAWAVRHRYLLASGLATLVTLLGAVHVGPNTDLFAFFLPGAHTLLSGHPFLLYQFRCCHDTSPPGLYPNANPPLSTWLMAAGVAVSNTLGWSSNPNYLAGTIIMEFVPFCLLLAFQIDSALLASQVASVYRYIVFLLALFSPLLWQSMIWTHVEVPMMLAFLLLGVRLLHHRRDALAGVFFGLALSSRTTAVLSLFPIFVALARERDWRGTVRVGATTLLVVAAWLVPFLLLDRSNTIYSLVTFHGSLGIGVNSIWTLFVETPLASLAQHLDTPTELGLAILLALLSVQRWHISARDCRIYGAMALCSLTFPLFNKMAWPYYYLEPFVFLLIWEGATSPFSPFLLWRIPVITLVYLYLTMTLSPYIWVDEPNEFFRRLAGLVEWGLMLSFMLAIWYRARAVEETSSEDTRPFATFDES